MGIDSAAHYLISFSVARMRKLDPVILHTSKTESGKCRTSHRLAFSR